MRRFALGLGFLTMASAPASAQSDVGPSTGAWGVEGATNLSASLMHFQSPRTALLLGIAANYARQTVTATGTFAGDAGTEDQYLLEMRLGARRYSRIDQRVRPFTTLSAIAGVSQVFGHEWHAGGELELGGSYFFSPHVSVGGSGALRGVYTRATADFGGGDTRTQKTVTASLGLFRLLAAVYF